MERLSFVEHSHTYRVDGEVVPSVTQVIKAGGKSTDYSHIPKNVLQRAGQIGTRVHKQVELFHAEGAALAHNDEPVNEYLSAYGEFLRDGIFTWQRSEMMMFCDCHRYAGTVDLVGVINDKPSVVDIKTTNQINTEKVELQTAAYKHLVTVNLDIVDPDRYILHLKKTGEYRLIECDDPTSWFTFESLVEQFYQEE